MIYLNSGKNFTKYDHVYHDGDGEKRVLADVV